MCLLLWLMGLVSWSIVWSLCFDPYGQWIFRSCKSDLMTCGLISMACGSVIIPVCFHVLWVDHHGLQISHHSCGYTFLAYWSVLGTCGSIPMACALIHMAFVAVLMPYVSLLLAYCFWPMDLSAYTICGLVLITSASWVYHHVGKAKLPTDFMAKWQHWSECSWG